MQAKQMQNTSRYSSQVMEELTRSMQLIDEAAAVQLADRIMQSGKVIVAGAGRSGLMMKAFAMRLMHLGKDVYVVGETITPGLAKEDLLLIGSGSGETGSLVEMGRKAKKLEGSLAAITLFPESTIGKLADVVIKLPGSPKDQDSSSAQTVQPMGSLFEQTLLLFLDSVILCLMEKQDMNSRTMYGKHANLE
jgi:6-phospho-3-hexuloisomerase